MPDICHKQGLIDYTVLRAFGWLYQTAACIKFHGQVCLIMQYINVAVSRHSSLFKETIDEN